MDTGEATPPLVLDAVDHQIIAEMVSNARRSNRSVARQLGLAAGTVSARLARLEAAGVIRGYRAVVEPSLVGRPLGFVIGLQITQGVDLDRILDELISIDEIDDVWVVTGNWDLMVSGRVSGPDSLNRLLTQTLWQSPSFRHSETMVITASRHKSP